MVSGERRCLLIAITKKGKTGPMVFGCGSNMMNIVSSIKRIPTAGGVGYFADESKVGMKVGSHL